MRCQLRLVLLLALTCCVNVATAEPLKWQGRPASELLDAFNSAGYQIIFSSDVVPDDLLILDEPDLADPMLGIAIALQALGLDLVDGPAGSMLVVKAVAPPPHKNTPVAAESPAAPLPEVVVTSSLHRLEYQQPGSHTYLDRELAARIPASAEEAVRITSRLPGTASGGISTRSHIRGGEANEVLFLLDGLRLYEPFHLKDFQSIATIVNANAIDGIDFYSGAYPARYGDRMSGVMNISLRTPQKSVETELALSFFNTSVLSMGTFGDSVQGEWLAAARRGNLDLIADVINPDSGNPDYVDYLIHGSWSFGPRAQISANFLGSKDKLTLNDIERGEQANADYENQVFWLKWYAEWGPTLRSDTTISFDSISNRRSGTLALPGIVDGQLDELREFGALGFSQKWTYVPSSVWMLDFGVDAKRQDGTYRFESTKVVQPPFDSILDNLPFESRNLNVAPEGAQYGAYLEARWQVSPTLILDAGIRWDRQSYTTSNNDEQTSPRLSILYRFNTKTELRLGWGQYSQAQEINELQASDGVDIFFPAQRAEHVVANLKHLFDHDVSLDISYYRKSFRVVRPRFENAFNSLTLLPEIQFDRYRVDPVTADAVGAEVMIRQGDGQQKLFWWVGYAWSEVRDKMPAQRIPRSWDQTHTIKAGLGWKLGHWDVSAAGEIHTGWPKTVLIANTVTNPDGSESFLLDTTALNSGRYPVFNSVDVRVSRDFTVRRGDLTVYLDVTNIYDRDNICCTEYAVISDSNGDSLSANEARWLPLIPSLGVIWRF